MRLRVLILAVLVLALIPLAAQPALADSVDFNALAPGSVSWAGGVGSTLTASSMNVTANHIPVGPSIFLAGAILSFTTGGFTSIIPGGFSFAGGGPISVGSSPLCGGSCFAGTFTSAQMLFSAGGGTATFIGNFIAGMLSPTLELLLGFPPGTNANATGSISATFLTAGGFDATTGGTGTWASGDLVLTPTPTPEPATLGLLGVGLIGLAFILRRRLGVLGNAA